MRARRPISAFALLPAYAESLTNHAICVRPLEGEPPRVELLMVARAEPHAPELDGLLELVRENVAVQQRVAAPGA